MTLIPVAILGAFATVAGLAWAIWERRRAAAVAMTQHTHHRKGDNRVAAI
jgi:hypothetical protein